jgi:hypothetical protein
MNSGLKAFCAEREELKEDKKNKRRKGGCENQERALLMR